MQSILVIIGVSLIIAAIVNFSKSITWPGQGYFIKSFLCACGVYLCYHISSVI